MRQRPSHLAVRQTDGFAFGDSAQIERKTGQRNSAGRWVENAAILIDIGCSTAPVQDVGRQRRLEEGGIRLNAARMFWTSKLVIAQTDDNQGDIIIYKEERWQVHEVETWDGSLYESMAVRVEGQS